MMLRQPWLSGLVAFEIVVAISDSDVGRGHSYCKRSKSGVLGKCDWEGSNELIAPRMGTDPWYWAHNIFTHYFMIVKLRQANFGNLQVAQRL